MNLFKKVLKDFSNGRKFALLFITCLFLILITLVLITVTSWVGNNNRESTSLFPHENEVLSFQSQEYICSGSCYCEEERRFSKSIPKTMRYMGVALSSFLAMKAAKDYFQEECLNEFSIHECPLEFVKTEVDDCEPTLSQDEDDSSLDDSFRIKPIGVVRSPWTDLKNMPIQPVGAKGVEGSIEIFENYEKGLKKLEGFTYIYILYMFNKVKETKLRVKPFMGKNDLDSVGVYATRAPVRPNGIGMSLLEVTRIEGNVIYVDGIDVLDGTPLIDIKPFIPAFEANVNPEKAKTGWFVSDEEDVSDFKSDDRFTDKKDED